MKTENCQIAVIGGGTGAAVAYLLAHAGYRVTYLDSSNGRASTLNNQKWKHSGCLYPDPGVAARMWDAFRYMHPLERESLTGNHAHFLAHNPDTIGIRKELWDRVRIPVTKAHLTDADWHSSLGPPKCLGGFRTPDSIIDFRRLLYGLTRDAAKLGAHVVSSAVVTELIRDGKAEMSTLLYRINQRQVKLHFAHCVVVTGAWTPELLRPVGINLPVQIFKSSILAFEGELVRRITTWLDPPFLTLVPFQGKTLISDIRRATTCDPNDQTPIVSDFDCLMEALNANFPALKPEQLKFLGTSVATKTEWCGPHGRNYDAAVFGSNFHGIPSLTVAFPGKASLMFSMGRAIAGRIARSMKREDLSLAC